MDFNVDAELEISLAELEVIIEGNSNIYIYFHQYIEAKYAAESQNGPVSVDTQFFYAWALLRSRYRDDRLLSIRKFEGREQAFKGMTLNWIVQKL